MKKCAAGILAPSAVSRGKNQRQKPVRTKKNEKNSSASEGGKGPVSTKKSVKKDQSVGEGNPSEKALCQ
jgi:hypothetical protein